MQQHLDVNNNNDKQYVWYCSYGSNLNKDRFMKYINGGTAVNCIAVHSGCRDKSDPIDSVFMKLPHVEMFFAKEGRNWNGGGVAFIRRKVHVETDETVVRMYLITAQQFVDVVAQENGIHDNDERERLMVQFVNEILPQCHSSRSDKRTDSSSIEHDYKPLVFLDHEHHGGKQWYDLLIYLGTRDRFPIFSFTNHEMNHVLSEEEIYYNTPSIGYMHTIFKGLKEGNTFSEEHEYVEYLVKKKGPHGKIQLTLPEIFKEFDKLQQQ